ncbi:MAG: DUF934 domain-containing protein [Alphaproteobacteria bacterium]
MAVIRNGRVVPDSWRAARGGPAGEKAGHVYVTPTQWDADPDGWRAHPGPLGLRLASDEPPARVADDLGRFSLVLLEFPVFTDGRAYSYARQLRQRYGFGGELRAVGEVLRDQLLFMFRCGFDSFETDIGDGDDAARDWAEAVGEVSVWYQTMPGDRRPPVARRDKRKAGGRR